MGTDHHHLGISPRGKENAEKRVGRILRQHSLFMPKQGPRPQTGRPKNYWELEDRAPHQKGEGQGSLPEKRRRAGAPPRIKPTKCLANKVSRAERQTVVLLQTRVLLTAPPSGGGPRPSKDKKWSTRDRPQPKFTFPSIGPGRPEKLRGRSRSGPKRQTVAMY